MAEKKIKTMLGYKYERKRINRDKALPPLCANYLPSGSSGNCEKANLCKNATYCCWEGKEGGICYGGTKSSEVEDRRGYVGKRWPEEVAVNG